MHTKRQCARCQVLHLHGDVLEIGLEGGPAVDDEEDVPVPVVDAPRSPLAPIGLNRVDPVRPEVPFAIVEQRSDLRHGPSHDVGLVARGHPGEVGQVQHCREGPAAQVDDVELHLGGCTSQGQRHDQ